MDNQSRSLTMDHREFQTLLWAENERVTMWKSLFGRERERNLNKGCLCTSRFLYTLCSADKTRDKRPAVLNGLKSVKRIFTSAALPAGCFTRHRAGESCRLRLGARSVRLLAKLRPNEAISLDNWPRSRIPQEADLRLSRYTRWRSPTFKLDGVCCCHHTPNSGQKTFLAANC